jgi:AraC-type transcriptional regulator N-terminus
MKVFSTTRMTAPLGNVAEPVVSLVAQGAKRSVLGSRAFDYRAGQFVVITGDLPLTSHISAASDGEPFVGVSLPIHPPTVADLLLESRLPAQAAPDGLAISVSDATPDLAELPSRGGIARAVSRDGQSTGTSPRTNSMYRPADSSRISRAPMRSTGCHQPP